MILNILVFLFSLVPLNLFAESYWVEDTRTPSFCVQNFNAYGPIYAPRIEERSWKITAFFQMFPKCEVIQLQEVWNSEQIKIFESSLSNSYSISAPNRENKIGLMSLLIGEIKDQETHFFKVNNQGGVLDQVRNAFNVRKAFHVIRARFPHIPEDIYFLNTHLHPSDQAVRLAQIVEILNWRIKNPDLKLVISGDFNSGIESLERQLLILGLGARDAMQEAFGGTYPLAYCTYCVENPLGWSNRSRVFDYIFYSNIGSGNFEIRPHAGEVNMKGQPQRPWSDHFGVRVNFLWQASVVIENRQFLEARRNYFLKVLEVSEKVLSKKSHHEFRDSVATLQTMQSQLTSYRGEFHDYFELFR